MVLLGPVGDDCTGQIRENLRGSVQVPQFAGFFNKAFEQKEYMENYVTEDVALEMLKQPEIQEEFAAKIKADPEFAKDPDKRFEFFYKKHASWDERLNKYPVFKK